MTGSYWRLKRAILALKKGATIVWKVFLNQCIVLYNMKNHLLTDGGLHSVSSFFATLCGVFRLKHQE